MKLKYKSLELKEKLELRVKLLKERISKFVQAKEKLKEGCEYDLIDAQLVHHEREYNKLNNVIDHLGTEDQELTLKEAKELGILDD